MPPTSAPKSNVKSYAGAGNLSQAPGMKSGWNRGGVKPPASFAGAAGHLASAKGIKIGFGQKLGTRKGVDDVTSKDFKKAKAKRGWWLAGSHGAEADVDMPEVNVEVEPRSYCSAVGKNGSMTGKECYRCLTTFCQKWHSFGKLELPLCHACMVLLGDGNKRCGYCGYEEDTRGGRSLFNCKLCQRFTHEECEKKWRSVGHNIHKICIVCEMGARIKVRDYSQHTMKLWEGDLPSVINHHIFNFSRYFKGMGPSKGVVWRQRAPIIAGELYTSGEAARVKSKRDRVAADRRVAGVTGGTAVDNASFDELLELTGKQDVHVQENSEISNIVQKFARKWDSLSSETIILPPTTIILPDLDELKRRRDEVSIVDAGAAALKRNASSMSVRQIQALDVLDGLAFPLRELGYCYLTRPFPVGASADDLSDPQKLDYSGVYRRLDPIQALFLFAIDLKLCPDHVTKVQAREIIFQTLGENPKFGNMCKYVQRGGGLLEQVDVERMTRSMATLSASVNAVSQGSMRVPTDSEFVSLAYGEDGVFKQDQKHVRVEKVFGSFFRRVVRYKSVKNKRFATQDAGTVGKTMSRAPSSPEPNKDNERADWAMAVEVQAMVSETMLDDPEYVQSLLSKYPTTEELEELEEQQIQKQEQLKANAEIIAGQRVPYELAPPDAKSQQFINWQNAFIDAFNFFADPPEESIIPPPPPNVLGRSTSTAEPPRAHPRALIGHHDQEEPTHHTTSIEQCFRRLDVDEDHLISRSDAEEALESAALADIFMMTWFPTADPDGVSWAEFVSDKGDALGSLWDMLLTEAEGVQERITRGVMLLQRSCATPWLERDGKEKGHHIIPVMEDDTRGLGMMLLVDQKGNPVVSKVIRPGPADEVMFGGDVLESVDGKSFKNMLPGRAIGTICGLWGNPERGPVKIGIQRNEEGNSTVVYENVERYPPDPPRQFPVERIAKARTPKGKVSFIDLGKMFRVLGLIPKILCDEELALLLDEVREGGDYRKDEELLVEWDDFFQLCVSLTRKRQFYKKINRKKKNVQLLRTTEEGDEPPPKHPVPVTPDLGPRSPLPGGIKLKRANALAEAGIDWAENHYQDGTKELGLAGPLLVSESRRSRETLNAEDGEDSSSSFPGGKHLELLHIPSDNTADSEANSPNHRSMGSPLTSTWGQEFSLSPGRRRRSPDFRAALESEDECLAKLFHFMSLPRCDGPLGKAWIEARHTQYLTSHSEAGRSGEKDMRIWNSPKALIRSDGVHRYIQTCRELGVPPIRSVLEQLRDFQSVVSLSNYSLGVLGTKALAASLIGNGHTVELILNGCGLSDEGVEALCEALKGNRKLTTLNLCDNQIGSRTISGVESKDVSRCVVALSNLFKVPNSTLYTLKMSSCGLTDRDIVSLTTGLKGNHSLNKLDLSCNEIGDKGAAALAKCVQFREHLEFVNLTWNRISPEGIKMIQHSVRIRNRVKKATPAGVFEPAASSASVPEGTEKAGGDDLMGTRDTLVGDIGTTQLAEDSEKEETRPAAKEQVPHKPDVKVRYDDGVLEGMDVAQVFLALQDVVENHAKERVKTPNVVVLTDALREEKPAEVPSTVIGAGMGMRRGGMGATGGVEPKKGAAGRRGTQENISPSRAEEWLKQFELEAIRAEADKDKNALPKIKVKKYLTIKAHASKDMTPKERLALLRMETKGYTLSVIQAWEQMQHFENTELHYEGSTFLITKVAGPREREKLLQMKQAIQAGSRILAARESSRSPGGDDDFMSDDEEDHKERGTPLRHWTAEDRGDDASASGVAQKLRKNLRGGGQGHSPETSPYNAMGSQNRMVVEQDPEDDGQALGMFGSSANFASPFASAMNFSASLSGSSMMMMQAPDSSRRGSRGDGLDSPRVTLPPVSSSRGRMEEGMSLTQAAQPLSSHGRKVASAKDYLI